MFGDEDIVKIHKKRSDALINIVILSFCIILARLWYLQIYKGQILYDFSLKNRLRKEIVQAPRGMIFSRNNHVLVDNQVRFDAVVTPQYLKDKEKTLRKLAKVLGLKISEVKNIIKKKQTSASYRPVVIKKNISRQEVAVIETESNLLPGVSVETFIVRSYTEEEVGAHLFGYISEIDQDQLPKYRKRDGFPYKQGDFIGQFGLEKKFDLSLRGKNGHEFVEVDALGRKKRHIEQDQLFKGIKNSSANPGHNIRLTIDKDLQKVAYKGLEGKVGSVVAVEIDTGEIMAMVSRPSFNPSQFGRGISKNYWGSLIQNEQKPLRNRAVQDHYAPGSVFKVVSLIAALEEGIMTPNSTVRCAGRFRLGRRSYHCWKRGGHGLVNAVGALRESCDVYFYKVATSLDINILAKYARMLGLGKKTGVLLPSEVSGLIPTREWKLRRNGEEWQKGETLSCIIGQSYMLTTPIQLAMAYSSIANGGTLYRPKIVKEIFSNAGELIQKSSPEKISKFKIKEQTMRVIRQGLYEVVNHRKGTVWWKRGLGLSMSGKTGTSQVIRLSAEKIYSKCDKANYKDRHHALFVGFAPMERPKIAVSAVVEHGCSGSRAASPIVRDVIDTYMKKYRPEQHKELILKQKRELKALANHQKVAL